MKEYPEVARGRWRYRGSQEPFYLTITPDGKMTAAWGANWAWGTVTIRNGEATFEMQPPLYEGTVRLYNDGAKPTLVLDDLWDSFNAQVSRAG